MKLYIASTEFFRECEYERFFNMMTPERKDAVNRLHFENARKQSVLGEMLARRGINALTGITEGEIVLARTERGKPYAVNADVHFSISHSKEYVVCFVSEDEIGVDIEQIRPVEARITNISCTDKDKEYIFGGSETETLTRDMQDRFFEVWTAKEAYFKYLGTGLIGLKTIDYEDIKPFCKRFDESGYMITLYSKSGFDGLMIKVI